MCRKCGAELSKAKYQLCRSCYLTSDLPKRIAAHNRGRTKPSQVRQMTPCEVAWVGALVEGEGSIEVNRPFVSVASTEVETLSTLIRFVGAGALVMQKGVNRPCWVWRLYRRASVRDLLRQIFPWLTGKREKAQKVLV